MMYHLVWWRKFVIFIFLINVVFCKQSRNNVRKRENNITSTSKKVVCYYTSWTAANKSANGVKFTPLDIDPNLCTHLVYAFSILDGPRNGLRPFNSRQDIDQGGYAEFKTLKELNENLKTLLSIGGLAEVSGEFSALSGNKARRSTFVKNVIQYLRRYNFDGLDIDWQYPTAKNGGQPADRRNYVSLIQELKAAFDKESVDVDKSRLLLSIVVPCNTNFVNGYDLSTISRYVDFMSIVTYDYHTPHDGYVSHYAPLHAPPTQNKVDTRYNVDATVRYYLKNGVEMEKLIVGIPTYGRSYTLRKPSNNRIGASSSGPGQAGPITAIPGYLTYQEICENIKNNSGWVVVHVDRTVMGPFAYRKNQWICYDDEDAAKLKGQYARENGLGGIMCWSLNSDDYTGQCHAQTYPIINAAKVGLLGKSKREDVRVSDTTTEEEYGLLGAIDISNQESSNNVDAGKICKDLGITPDPDDCSKYFLCLNTGSSNLGVIAQQISCPAGLLFNNETSSCDLSKNVKCDKPPNNNSAIDNRTDQDHTPSTPTAKSAPEPEASPQIGALDFQDPKVFERLAILISKLAMSNAEQPATEKETTTTTTPTPTTKTSTRRTTTTEEYYPARQQDEVNMMDLLFDEDPEVIKLLLTLIRKLTKSGMCNCERPTTNSQKTRVPIGRPFSNRVDEDESTKSPILEEQALETEYTNPVFVAATTTASTTTRRTITSTSTRRTTTSTTRRTTTTERDDSWQQLLADNNRKPGVRVPPVEAKCPPRHTAPQRSV